MTGVRTPPFLLGAVLLFWGYLTGFLGIAAIMALIIELPHFSKGRWVISEEDFSRIWVFCSLLLLAGVVYAFTLNDGPSRFAEMFDDLDLRSQARASASSAKTAAAIVRWLPMIFFLFIAAQEYSARGGVPLVTVSLILRRRWKEAKKRGQPLPGDQSINISYFYFILCLFAASINAEEDRRFFWGSALLAAYALWPLRSRRFGYAAWAGSVVAATVLAFYGQAGIDSARQYLENLNPQWLTTMGRGRTDPGQAKTALGQIGRLKLSPAIVVRLKAKDGPVPQYLREASYTSYREQSWSPRTHSPNFEGVTEENPPSGVFTLVPGKTNIARVEIAALLPGGAGVVPLPATTGRLTNMPAFTLSKNVFGAVYAQGPGLMIFDALFGPGPMMDSPPNEIELSTERRISWHETNALDQVILELGLRGMSQHEVLTKLQEFFSGFKYSTWQERPRRYAEMSPLSLFLLKTRTGHCEYFATATVLLLQRLGIPARYAVGYAVHEPGAGERSYVVRQRDAHSWCMVWDSERSVWRDFDTTPASWVEAESHPDWRQKLSDVWSRIKFEFLRLRWGQTRLRQYILWIVIPILIVLLGQIVFSRRKRLRGKITGSEAPSSWPGLDSEFYEIEKRLVRRGFIRQPGEPASLWLRRGIRGNPDLSGTDDELQELLRLHYRYRFDPEGLSKEDREMLRQHARDLLKRFDRPAHRHG